MSKSTADTESGAYRWDESEWFSERELPGYGDSEEADLRAEVGEGDDWGGAHDFRAGTDKHEWLAFKILRQTGRVLCATTLFAPPNRPDCAEWTPALAYVFDGDQVAHDPAAMHERNREVELSEPRVTIPKAASEQWGGVDYGQFRYDRRVNEETGYVSGGESTGCVVADRPLPAFMTVVETVVAMRNLLPEQARQVREFARQLKQEGTDRDKDILAKVLAATAE